MKNIIKTLHIKGMTCASCSAAVERNVSKAEGIIKAGVNLTTEKLTVEYDPQKINVDEISNIVNKLGFKVESQPNLREITIPVEGMN